MCFKGRIFTAVYQLTPLTKEGMVGGGVGVPDLEVSWVIPMWDRRNGFCLLHLMCEIIRDNEKLE